MKASKLKELKEKYTPDEIIAMYMSCKIYLTDKQLEKICASGSHHGGCILGGKR